MRLFSSISKSSVALGMAILLGFGVTANDAFGIAEGLKTAIKQNKSEPVRLLRNWGLDNSEYPSHINARKAWKITKGKKSIRVCVVDTGIDATHPDLKDNICRKSGSDEYGYDFVLNRKNPGDFHGHGSHVSGIVGATAKAEAGASGVAPNVCIMAVRYYSDTASGAQNLNNTVKAINYCVDNDADIINYSGGGAEYSASEMKAIQRAEAKGILFVAAAGNEYQNTDEDGNSYYPAAYGLSNIISVAATNIKNELLPSSNWGKKHVHVAAPGEHIFSTLPKGRYGYLTGTSQATAFVSGLAALILSENKDLTPSEVRDIIMKSADRIKNLETKIASGGRINAYSALQLTLAGRTEDRETTVAELDQSSPSELKARRNAAQREVAFH